MNDRRERYSEYLHGEHWRHLKASVIRARGHRCEVCYRAEFLEGHHLTYRNPLEACTEADIMILCRRCHDLAHESPVLDDLVRRGEIPNQVKRHQIMATLIARLGGRKTLERIRAKATRLRREKLKEMARQQPLRESRKPRSRWVPPPHQRMFRPIATSGHRATVRIKVSYAKFEYGSDGRMYRTGFTPAHLRLPLKLRHTPPGINQ